MKNKLFTAVLALSAALLTSMSTRAFCQTTDTGFSNANRYPADIAWDNVHLFDSFSRGICLTDTATKKTYKIDSIISSFTISSKDLLMAMGIPNYKVDSVQYDHIRAYLGLAPIFKNNDRHYQFKLFLVPVKHFIDTNSSEGYDMVLDSANNIVKPDSSTRECLINKYVLDLNSPCPNYCNFTSLFPKPTSNITPTLISNYSKRKKNKAN